MAMLHAGSGCGCNLLGAVRMCMYVSQYECCGKSRTCFASVSKTYTVDSRGSCASSPAWIKVVCLRHAGTNTRLRLDCLCSVVWAPWCLGELRQAETSCGLVFDAIYSSNLACLHLPHSILLMHSVNCSLIACGVFSCSFATPPLAMPELF